MKYELRLYIVGLLGLTEIRCYEGRAKIGSVTCIALVKVRFSIGAPYLKPDGRYEDSTCVKKKIVERLRVRNSVRRRPSIRVRSGENVTKRNC